MAEDGLLGVLSELGGRDLEGGEPVVGLKDSGARVRLGGHGVYGIRKLSRKDPMARGGLFSGEEEVEGAFAVEDSERGGAGAGILDAAAADRRAWLVDPMEGEGEWSVRDGAEARLRWEGILLDCVRRGRLKGPVDQAGRVWTKRKGPA